MSLLLVVGWLLAVGAATLLLVARLKAHRTTERIIDACHELRGPLTTMMLALDATSPTAADRPEVLAAVTGELARARRAVEDLGAAASVHARVDDRRPVDLDDLLRELVAIHDARARVSGRRVVLDAAGGSPSVLGDRVRLAQALGNLVENGLEHGAGTIRVSRDTHDARVRIIVDDEGPGLPRPVPALLAESRRGQHGRGLRIVGEVLAAHGGALRAAPAPASAGARLVAELPALTLDAAALAR